MVSFEIIKSKIFIHVIAKAETEVNIGELRGALFTWTGNIVNLCGFNFVLGISYEIDSITVVDQRWTQVIGVEGFVFDGTESFVLGLTFRPTPFGGASLNLDLLQYPSVCRTTFELRNSIRYPDFTALHCRLALESIRNHFDAVDEGKGWRLLRESLNVRRETIESFQEAAIPATRTEYSAKLATKTPSNADCLGNLS